jgi:signal transduction histidine kinase
MLPSHIHRRLKQIILNLAWNAVKFTDAGFVRINVSAISADAVPPSSAVTLHIAVVDSGRGIAASDLAMLFQSWQQINPTNELSENVRVRIFQLNLLSASSCQSIPTHL